MNDPLELISLLNQISKLVNIAIRKITDVRYQKEYDKAVSHPGTAFKSHFNRMHGANSTNKDETDKTQS
jgi:hypothetical protein